ncbi:MAG: peptidoglycan-associated lipoprotein Pal [candidate division KSB1 bacterium]|nr:peptidoglycan-associated lipoprotein Pal [candidate division KSB1 bacterium]
MSLLLIITWASCSKKVTKTAPQIGETSAPAPSPPPIESERQIAPIDLDVKETAETTEEIVFQDINFDFDRYDLTPRARDILANHARILKENPQIKLTIEGHCDERGTIEYNLALGERRANAAKEYLVKYGIDPSRIRTISYGKERPLDPRSNEEAWAKNRRAAFVIRN